MGGESSGSRWSFPRVLEGLCWTSMLMNSMLICALQMYPRKEIVGDLNPPWWRKAGGVWGREALILQGKQKL